VLGDAFPNGLKHLLRVSFILNDAVHRNVGFPYEPEMFPNAEGFKSLNQRNPFIRASRPDIDADYVDLLAVLVE